MSVNPVVIKLRVVTYWWAAGESQRTMTLFVPNIGYLCVLVVTSMVTSDWDQEIRDYILDIHNEKRRGEGGCQMNKLVYDMELERQSKQWAENCVFRHESKEGRGENLAYSTYKRPEKDKILQASDNWFNEKDEYSYGQYSCMASLACHYTQMVWDSTSKVSCYTHTCPNLVDAYRNAWYLVCFYTPKGNWNGEKPYERSCTTPCREGQTEEKGLCVGEAKEKCEDKDTQCAMWAKDKQCQSNPVYMLKNCKKSCNQCNNNTKCPEGQTEEKGLCVGEAKGNTTGGAAEKCEDKNTQCDMWAKGKQCHSNPGYMLNYCQKSCNQCNNNTKCPKGHTEEKELCVGEAKGNTTGGAAKKCEDKNTQCAMWAKNKQCHSNPGYMLKNCIKSCNKCNSKTACVDNNNQCPGWASRGECKYNPSYMLKNCQKSCHEC
ncbi:Cysteine-rich secretory protein LCCL domain-containing 2 [Bulinus truncatus]|nr:Cysteine-rich secretory protein LCCL domain-containing 2 [Bulinus truncatus]